MANRLSFTTLDVFTESRFAGNQLAIVELPAAASLTQAQKQAVAREFNYSETVFLHEDAGPGMGRRAEIFTIYEEIPFAGHPTIGTLCYIGMTSQGQGSQHIKLSIKAGTINANFDHNTRLAQAEIPHNVHVHAVSVDTTTVVKSQPLLEGAWSKVKDAPEYSTFPIVSIVKGMTFILVRLPQVSDSLETVQTSPIPIAFKGLDEEWLPSLVGAYYYVILPTTDSGVTRIRTRMVEADIGEDPATGSAASALSSYLALQAGGAGTTYNYEIEQGVEMGRRSMIGVCVRLNASGNMVEKVVLEGTSIKIMEGTIEV